MSELYDLTTEYLVDPMGIEAVSPRLSWKIHGDARGIRQVSYRIFAGSEGALLWDSGTVESADQCVRYAGRPLESRERVTWRVEVMMQTGSGTRETLQSGTASFEMGLLTKKDWKAQWIVHPDDNRQTRLVPVFRRRFEVRKNLQSARLYITSHGLYHAFINGQEVTDHKFTPGLTSYYYRIQYGTYDVTPLLSEGTNVIGMVVGDGWWRWNNNFGYQLALFAQLELFYEDGTKDVIPTDERFQVSTGSIVLSDPQKGEVFDARRQPEKWMPAAITGEHTDATLTGIASVPVREKETFPGQVTKDSNGRLVIDFGQNIAGYVKMTLRDTRPGQKVHLQHGEGLDLSGRFSVQNCNGGRSLFQEIEYTCKGGRTETYQPTFSVFGFRYLLVEGYDAQSIQDGDFTAIALYSDMGEAGYFTCSNDLINRLAANALWSQKGNFLDAPVDCPTRERNTWTGDAQIYVRTAAYLMNVYPLFEKWMKDQTIEQYASGKVGITFPSTSSVHNEEELDILKAQDSAAALAGPTGNGSIGEDSVGWGDSAVWIPYQLYLMYGDRQILANQYDTARKWLDYSLGCMKNPNPLYKDKPWYQDGNGEWIYDTLFHYGEWNEPLPPDPEVIAFFRAGGTGPGYVRHFARYGKPEVATAYTKRSCDNVAWMAEVLGKTDDAAKYRRLSAKIKACYDRYMIGEDGVIQKGHQAAYIRALALDLVSEEKKPLVIQQLQKELAAADYHLSTGFLSTVYLLPTLCENGMTNEAYRILEQTTSPSWLHPILLGATTMLERWDGLDTFRDSFNHYSFGAVVQFLFEYIAGIRPESTAPGFRKFLLHPVSGGSLTSAEASYNCPYGMIRSAWERKDSIFSYKCTVPVGTSAHLILPDGEEMDLESGEYEFSRRLL